MAEFDGGGAAQGAVSGAATGTMVMPGWGTLIGAALGGLAGGLSGGGNGYSGKGKWPGNSQELFDFQKDAIQKGIRWRVADAKAAGIHPLFALGASIPSGGFSTPVIPGGSSGSVMGDVMNGLGATAEAYANYRDRKELRAQQDAAERAAQARIDREEARQERLVDAQVLEASSSAALNNARAQESMATLQREARTAMLAPSLNARRDATASRTSGLVGVADEPQKPLGVGFGKGLSSGTGVADASDIENRYGEIAGDVFGLYKLTRDAIRSLPQSWGSVFVNPDYVPPQYDQMGNPY